MGLGQVIAARGSDIRTDRTFAYSVVSSCLSPSSPTKCPWSFFVRAIVSNNPRTTPWIATALIADPLAPANPRDLWETILRTRREPSTPPTEMTSPPLQTQVGIMFLLGPPQQIRPLITFKTKMSSLKVLIPMFHLRERLPIMVLLSLAPFVRLWRTW